MNNPNIYQDIANRTDGDIYIGVVGPVRTGKSTFIKKFMDLLVIPNIDNPNRKERTKDELPQSASGRTIMTTEPKFIPNEAVEIKLDDATKMKIRLVDCVGYIVKSANGYIENDSPRMVTTPWFTHQIPFEEAAEIGTKKVITEHSTIGIVVTTDGTISDIERDDYIEPEERVISELKALNKPFVIVLNTATPTSESTLSLKGELENKYNVPIIVMDCLNLDKQDINDIFNMIITEFPISQVNMYLPKWIEVLEPAHWLKANIINTVKNLFESIVKMIDLSSLKNILGDHEYIKNINISNINAGNGIVDMAINLKDNLFYKILSETSGMNIDSEYKLIEFLKEMAGVKRNYDKIKNALDEVKQKGYGIVSPTIDELTLEEPQIVKQGARFGVKLKASAPSIHMIRADIETEVSPIVGTERQSEELVNSMLKEFETDPQKIWDSNIFGRSLHEIVNDGLHNKLSRMSEDSQFKLQETLQRIINEGSGGLICIII